MRTHLENNLESSRSNFKEVKSRSPFLVSASWHSKQLCSMKRRRGWPGSLATIDAVAQKSRKHGSQIFINWVEAFYKDSLPRPERSEIGATIPEVRDCFKSMLRK